MTPTQVKEVSKIVTESALEFLAELHSCTVAAITQEIARDNGKIAGQFLLLIKSGTEEAVKHVAGLNNQFAH